MKKILHLGVLVISMLFLIVSYQAVSAQARERPFKGRITGSFVSSPTPAPSIYNCTASAKGYETHFGMFTKVTRDVINMDSMAVVGTFVMTNPADEQLTGKYIGRFSFGTTPGTFSWLLTATITGGTGRFSDASGNFVFRAKGNHVVTEGVITGEYRETFEGTIAY